MAETNDGLRPWPWAACEADTASAFLTVVCPCPSRKIFIDYLRNGEGASAVAPYSTRARKGAPIALPLAWTELKTVTAADQFHMNDAVKRLKRDPWRAMTTATIAGQRLPEL